MRALQYILLVVMALCILVVAAIAVTLAWQQRWVTMAGAAVITAHWGKLWRQSWRCVRGATQLCVHSTPDSTPNPYYEAWKGALADPRKDDCGRPTV